MKRLIFISLVLLVFNGLHSYSQEKSQHFPDSVWIRHDSLEIIGYDSRKTDSLREYIIEEMNTTGLVVVVDGKILFEYGDIDELSYVASCRKSILSMLYGKYVENGTINLDNTLEELDVNDIGGLLPIERQATIRHLVTARSGVYHARSNDGDNTADAPERGSVDPGTYFLYNNWDFNAAGGIFEKLTKKSIYEALEQDIAIPIQMQDFRLDKQEKSGDSTKSKYLAYHIWLSTRDMARLGLLMLNNGNWNGQEVISENWVKLTTSTVTPQEEMNPSYYRNIGLEYGYMWWILNRNDILEDTYFATGSFGQHLYIIPKLNMVISHKTKSEYGRRTSYSDFQKLLHKILDLRIEP